MIVLGIETSCDETGIALLKDGKEVLSSFTKTQMIHSEYGGVVPELASREHLNDIYNILDYVMNEANINYENIDLISVTKGPGLIGALLVGINVAKGLALVFNKPLIGVNHMEGHIFAAHLYKKDLKPPYIGLIVSGGHTLLIDVTKEGEYFIEGSTVDDAAGEAFDKTAKLLGLGYPGGPLIEKYSKKGNENAIKFPIAKMEGYKFSFSGLKTAVRYYVEKLSKEEKEEQIYDICASLQKAIVTPLVNNAVKLCREKRYDTITLSGGVAANGYLRNRLLKEASKYNINVVVPPIKLCTDNGEMIAAVGYARFMKGEKDDLNMEGNPSLKYPFRRRNEA